MNLLLNKPFYRLSSKYFPECVADRMHVAGLFRTKR